MKPALRVPAKKRSLRFARLFTTNIPRLDKPVWTTATSELLAKFKASGGAMTIDEVIAWGDVCGDSGSVIRHKLAWLSVHGLVDYDKQRGVWKIS